MKQSLVLDKKHQLKINNFLKLHQSGIEILDVDKIVEVFHNFNQFFILSPRGLIGKTTNLKIRALDDYEKFKKQSLFVRNQQSEIDDEMKRFLENSTCEADERFYDCEVKTKEQTMYWNKERVLDFQSMYNVSKMKGTRRHYANIIVDEMNEGMTLLHKNITQNISSLNASTFDIVKQHKQVDDTKVWFLGNLKTINHPYLIACGITDIHSSCDVYYDKAEFNDGTKQVRPAFVLLCMQFNKKEKEKILKERWNWDWRMRNDVRINEAEHTYFNQSFTDELLNVGMFPKNANRTMDFVLNVNNHDYLGMWKVHNRNAYYCELIDINDIKQRFMNAESFVFSKKDIGEKKEHFPKLLLALKEMVWKNQIYYHSRMARSVFLTNLINS